jgi:RNA polymerase sigma factor (sigma-70 family)
MSKVIDGLRRAVLADAEAARTDGQLLECFISRCDEAAVAALVRRHGPMVWGVCRRLLPYHDAEDAFQATFLVLVRKATSILPREMIAHWLYGVAHQTALKARATTAKRGAREQQVKEMPEPEARVESDLWRELQPLLDQELARLPEKYRVAIVLCDLVGKSRKEAARQLKIPEGTLSSRLTTARKLLAKRLTRHGLAMSGGALAALLAEKVSASVPASVASSTIKAATLMAAGSVATDVISVQVAALMEGVLKTMLFTKLKLTTAVLLAAVLLVVGYGVVMAPAQTGRPTPAPVETKREPRVKWEYKAIAGRSIEQLAPPESKDKLTDGLNALGEQGWELVTVEPNASWGLGGGGFGGGNAGAGRGAGGGGFGGGGGGGGRGAGNAGFGGGARVGLLSVYLFKRPK